jgi:hypothetical protein
MAEVIINGSGVQYPLVVNSDGSININSASTSNPLPINDATANEALVLLRRMVKLLESNAVVDIQNRQKIIIDSVTLGGTSLGVAVNGLSSLAGVPSPNAPTANAPIQQVSSSNWLPVWTGPVDSRFQIIDAARNTYANAIRSKITF